MSDADQLRSLVDELERILGQKASLVKLLFKAIRARIDVIEAKQKSESGVSSEG